MTQRDADLAAWALSGAMALTGPRLGPPRADPAPLVGGLARHAVRLGRATASWGRAVDIDAVALLGERAAITGMGRNGDVSVGGAARFVRVADGWVVLNLPRPSDVASLPALVERSVSPDDWSTIAAVLATMPAATVVERATLLALAVGHPTPTRAPAPTHAPTRPANPTRVRTETPAGRDRPVVIDLSSLWAGPLCASLLAAAGARVIKVEGVGRPDGARRGATAFFDLLNAGKECISLDFTVRADIALLHRLIAAADLVIEASRPRVMDALGIHPDRVASAGTSWLSITAYGRTGPAAHRIGFGDDTAVSGGLQLPATPPMFVADAVADPIAGLAAAVVGAELLATRTSAAVEVPLAGAAAEVAPNAAAPHEAVADGDRWVLPVGSERVEVAEPRHRPIPSPAEAFGAHDGPIRAEFVATPG